MMKADFDHFELYTRYLCVNCAYSSCNPDEFIEVYTGSGKGDEWVCSECVGEGDQTEIGEEPEYDEDGESTET